MSDSQIDCLDYVIKQAERYEKLRKLNPRQYADLYNFSIHGPHFDGLVDTLEVAFNPEDFYK